jgi:tetratricopeptide (TPR) repeat protein
VSDDSSPNLADFARRAGSTGVALFQAGRFREALAQFETALALLPADVDLRYNLACSAWACSEIQRTRAELGRILQVNPAYAKAHDALARLLNESRELQAADLHSATAVQLSPTDPEFALTRAVILSSLGRPSEAWDAIRPALTSPLTADRAAALCARIAPRIKKETEAASIVDETLQRPPGPVRFRRQLHFAAAALSDRMGRYDQAFSHAASAHSIQTRPYDAAARDREFHLRISHWTGPRVAALARATHGSARPVFILGMPRSGTSLVEQILACHPRVHAAGELDAMNQTAKALDALGNPYPRALESLTPQSANQIASVYLNFISTLDASAPYVTDKMPLNFIYLDLIAVLFPDCHVIHCTRDPMDTCLSCYMTEFEPPYPFAEDLHNLGSFYNHYRALMAHWHSVLPVKMLEVNYENVVADVEGQTRRLLGFLGLEWDDRCLRFHESPREVKTASRDQVRRPIYASSVGRWKHYEKYLAPLLSSLLQFPR